MKRLGPVLALALTGCPNWEAERAARCLALDASTGVCARPDAGAAGTDAGGVDAGAVDAGGGVVEEVDGGAVSSPFPEVTPSGQLQTYDNGMKVRRPVFLWEVPGRGNVMAVEAWDGGFSIWNQGQASAIGSFTSAWAGSAVSEGSTLLGCANSYGPSSNSVNVDNFDGGPINNTSFTLISTPTALSAYQRADGGLAYLAIRRASGFAFERATCMGCNVDTFLHSASSARVDEAVSDGTQRTWVAGGTGLSVVALEVLPDSNLVARHVLGEGGSAGVQLSAAGSAIHAAWLEGQTLWLAGLSSTGGLNRRQSWQLSEPARLVDLVENAKAVVAILELPGGTVLLVHDASGDSFHRIQAGFLFRAAVAHLGTSLRVAGQCLFADGGVGGDSTAGCQSAANNPVLEFATMPDGGDW